MKINKFLKSYWMLYIFIFFLLAFELIFLKATLNNLDVMILFAVVTISLLLLYLVFEYLHKYSFYKELKQQYQTQDNEFYSTLSMPSFYEGKLLYETIEELHSAYLRKLHGFEISQNEYRNYLELWVHEIKTPLAASKLLVENEHSDSHKRLLGQLQRIEDYVEQALYYARSSNPNKDYIVKKVDLNPLIQSLLVRNRDSFIHKHIQVNLNVDQSIFVYSDEKWLIFILQQILDNALKYTDEGGSIKINVQQLHNNVVLSIKDTGIGIEDGEIQRVFDKFFTGSNGRKVSKSTGIGLYLCKQLCDKLYIGLDIHSQLHNGCEIILTFPENSMFHSL